MPKKMVDFKGWHEIDIDEISEGEISHLKSQGVDMFINQKPQSNVRIIIKVFLVWLCRRGYKIVKVKDEVSDSK